MKLRWVRNGLAIAGLAMLVSSAPAIAQDDGVDESVLDDLRALVPEGAPGEDDLQDGDARLGQMISVAGENGENAIVEISDSSKLEGVCGGWADSYDENGDLIDSAMAIGNGTPPIDALDGGQAFTGSNRFKVDTRGLVVYYGFMPRSGEGPMDHEWYIKTGGISLDKGGDPNSAGNNINEGIVDLAEDLPIKFSANVQVEGRLDSANIGSCIGEGHVEFIGNGLTDPVGLAAIALFAGGFLGLLFNARPARTWRGSA